MPEENNDFGMAAWRHWLESRPVHSASEPLPKPMIEVETTEVLPGRFFPEVGSALVQMRGQVGGGEEVLLADGAIGTAALTSATNYGDPYGIVNAPDATLTRVKFLADVGDVDLQILLNGITPIAMDGLTTQTIPAGTEMEFTCSQALVAGDDVTIYVDTVDPDDGTVVLSYNFYGVLA